MAFIKQPTKTPLPPSEAYASTKLWHNHAYLLLWGGQAISGIGSGVSNLVFPLLVLYLTQSPAQAGFIAACEALPYFLVALPAGTLVDQLNRKRVMMICDTGRALCLASVSIALLFNQLSLVQLYTVALLEGTFAVFFDLAMASCLPRIVTQEQLPDAVAQQQFIDSFSDFIGSPLGGLLYSLGHIVPFLVDAISYLASVFSLFFIKIPFQQERTSNTNKTLKGLWEGVKEGQRWLWSHPLIRTFALLTSGINVIFPTRNLIVVVIAQSQHVSSVTIGIIIAIGSCGSIFGSLLSSRLQKRLSIATLVKSVFWLFVVFWPLLALPIGPILLGCVLVGISFIRPVYGVAQVSYRLAIIPDALQGRVNSVFRLTAQGARPIGLALVGILMQTSGVQFTVLFFWGGLLLLAIFATFSRTFRMQVG